MRNRQTYRAMNQVASKQICAPISKDLRKKYSRRSARIMLEDTIRVIRGEYKGITGKVSKISTQSNSIAIEGNKKEKLKGDKIDVYIHVTNVIITALNTDDKWRINKLEGKNVRSARPEPVKVEPKAEKEKQTAKKEKNVSTPTNKKSKTEKKKVEKKLLLGLQGT